MSGNVIEFRRRTDADDTPEAEARFKRADRATCQHRPFTIDADQRTVQCGTCGEWLDPIWCLLELMKRDDAIDRKLAAIKAHQAKQARKQKRAIAHKTRKKLMVAAKDCQACGGTGWAPTDGRGVVPCQCRRAVSEATRQLGLI